MMERVLVLIHGHLNNKEKRWPRINGRSSAKHLQVGDPSHSPESLGTAEELTSPASVITHSEY